MHRLETGGYAYDEDGYFFVVRRYPCQCEGPSLPSSPGVTPLPIHYEWRYDFGSDGLGYHRHGFATRKLAVDSARRYIAKLLKGDEL